MSNVGHLYRTQADDDQKVFFKKKQTYSFVVVFSELVHVCAEFYRVCERQRLDT